MDDNLNLQNNPELNEALQEFEVKSAPAPLVQTESNANVNPEMPRMVQFVIKHSFGLVKEQKVAEYVLLAVALLSLGVSLFLFFGNDNAGVATDPRVKNNERLLPPPPKN